MHIGLGNMNILVNICQFKVHGIVGYMSIYTGFIDYDYDIVINIVLFLFNRRTLLTYILL